jgi:GTP 3',8-cyclase
MLFDAYKRQIKDLRIGLTDRCNFRCFYCRPVCETVFAAKESILTFEEIVYISEIFVGLGIEKIRLTGGEPLLRKGVENLIEKLAALKFSGCRKINPESRISNPKLKDLAVTTNGFSLARRAADLKRAGLDRATISLDSLKRDNFRKITGADKLEEVLEGIAAAQKIGLSPVKINAVIIRGCNENEIAALAGFARETGVSMRFIEFMPLDSGSFWRREQVVSGKEIYEEINARFPLKPKQITRGSETARRYVFADGAPGEIGIIAPVTEMFCGACSRIRLTADGQIRTCLFSAKEYNLRDFIRRGASRNETADFIRATVLKKEMRHHINEATFHRASRSMSFIGG